MGNAQKCSRVNLLQTHIIALLLSGVVWSQKPVLSNDSWRTWTTLSPRYGIRDDGHYCWYQYGSPATGDTLCYHALDGHISRVFAHGFNPTFAAKHFLFQLPAIRCICLQMIVCGSCRE
ncbi:hypothetical protein [Chitinophaga pinensis]|uniref:Uncharacterized protein n=1 Tax=Chitinophaga pinensis TaxID=79329 RepID=A0A5C6LLA1_9BACT|nr:hypothetical protein [Chitinophaga pinensis]TWV94294.1 hypothetical protein FEF09_25815 [Chitinophaga pinensis]